MQNSLEVQTLELQQITGTAEHVRNWVTSVSWYRGEQAQPSAERQAATRTELQLQVTFVPDPKLACRPQVELRPPRNQEITGTSSAEPRQARPHPTSVLRHRTSRPALERLDLWLEVFSNSSRMSRDFLLGRGGSDGGILHSIFPYWNSLPHLSGRIQR